MTDRKQAAVEALRELGRDGPELGHVYRPALAQAGILVTGSRVYFDRTVWAGRERPEPENEQGRDNA
ncbi:MAG: hypothetical protein LBP22_08745 [Deltaproteobacteria bacterium]|jgi:hypothetical protein|nr:hypothetical protein [Deltaproteobacteria bacterium]